MAGFYAASIVSSASYVSVFLAVLGLVLGFVLGAVLALYGFRAAEKSRTRKKRRKKKRQEKKKESRKKESRKKESKGRKKRGSEDTDMEEDTIRLKERMTDKGNSWSDFNCAADGVDEEEYVENARKQQNKSYTYVLRKNRG